MANLKIIEGDAEVIIARSRDLADIYEEREGATVEEYPKRYKSLAVKALRRGEISIGRLSEYLSISRQEAMRYVNTEDTGDEEILFRLRFTTTRQVIQSPQ